MIKAASRAAIPATILAVSATAWIALWRLGESPWGHLSHQYGHGGHLPSPLSSIAASSLAFLAGWVVMTMAMMLPTTLPLVQIFRRLTNARPDRTVLLLLVVGGYLFVWALCGVVVLVASLVVQSAAGFSAWLVAHPKTPTAALFLVAGTFQFSSLKYRCLDKCRSPMSFVSSYWRGSHERWQSLRLGVAHGAFCVGCCWALMLLMFAASSASLLWMIALGSVMAAEKNLPGGRRLSMPLGVLFLAASALVAAS